MDRRELTPLAALFVERQPELRRFLRARLGDAADIDDLMQEVFLKASAVDPGTVIGNPGAYLYRLAANVLLDRARAKRRAMARDAQWRTIHHSQVDGEDIVGEADAEASVMARQRLNALSKALESLAPQTQRAFRLHKLAGLTHAETAAQMGVSKSAIEKHISLALKHLAAKTAGYK